MKASNLSREELLKENRRLIKNIGERMKRIEELDLTSPIYASSKFKELKQNLPNKLTDLDDKGLKTLYRDLKYINALKSSTKAGAKAAQERYEPIRKKLEVLSPDLKSKVWEIYSKVYDQYGRIKYKYNFLDAISDMVMTGEDTEKIVSDLIDLYDEAYQEVGGASASEFAMDKALNKALEEYRDYIDDMY